MVLVLLLSGIHWFSPHPREKLGHLSQRANELCFLQNKLLVVSTWISRGVSLLPFLACPHIQNLGLFSLISTHCTLVQWIRMIKYRYLSIITVWHRYKYLSDIRFQTLDIYASRGPELISHFPSGQICLMKLGRESSKALCKALYIIKLYSFHILLSKKIYFENEQQSRLLL